MTRAPSSPLWQCAEAASGPGVEVNVGRYGDTPLVVARGPQRCERDVAERLRRACNAHGWPRGSLVFRWVDAPAGAG